MNFTGMNSKKFVYASLALSGCVLVLEKVRFLFASVIEGDLILGHQFKYYASILQFILLGILCFLAASRVKKIWLINSSIFIGFWFLLEGGFGFFAPPSGTFVSIPANYFIDDDLLGYKPAANRSVSAIRTTIDKDIIHNVRYTIDANHHRFIPASIDPIRKFALFFGCSFTFGEGVEDVATFAHQFQMKSKGHQSYNFGFSGYGTQQMLAKLSDGAIDALVKEKNGVGIYCFIEHHIKHNVGGLGVISWGNRHPYYVEKEGKLVRQGNFRTGRSKIVNFALRLLTRSYILKSLNVDVVSLFVNGEELTAKMINEAFRQYNATFGNDAFYVVVLDGTIQNIRADLNPSIRILEYSHLIAEQNLFLHPLDRHPNAIAHERIARQLVIALGKSNH